MKISIWTPRFPLFTRKTCVLAAGILSISSASAAPLSSELRALADQQKREAQAACAPVDLTLENPHFPLNKARNQSTGWCFAYSAADLLSIKLGEEISGAALASSYIENAPLRGGSFYKTARNALNSLDHLFSLKTTSREGGYLDRVLQTAINEGYVCTEDSVPSQFASVGELDEYNDAIFEVDRSHLDIIELTEEDVDQDPNCINNEVKSAANQLFPGLNLKDLVRVAQDSTGFDYHARLVEAACEKVPLPKGKAKFKVGNLDLDRRDDYMEKSAGRAGVKAINTQLDKKNPVLIAYSSVALQAPGAALRSAGKPIWINGKWTKYPETHVDHASVVTGRIWSEKKGGQCLYQVKNSWGTDCSVHSPEFECVNGVVWVDEDTMVNMLGTVTWLE